MAADRTDLEPWRCGAYGTLGVALAPSQCRRARQQYDGHRLPPAAVLTILPRRLFMYCDRAGRRSIGHNDRMAEGERV